MNDPFDCNDPTKSYSQYTVGLGVFKNTKDERYFGKIVSRFLTLDRELRFVLEIEGTGILKIEKGADLDWIARDRSII